MSNQYIYNNYQQYSPNLPHPVINSNGGGVGPSINPNTSPTAASLTYISPPQSSNNSLLSSSTTSSTTSGSSITSLNQQQQAGLNSGLPSSNYSFHTPRLRYYLSKSFDIEDDLEFCPEISESYNTSPTIKKFNPYTATVFSPSQEIHGSSGQHSSNSSTSSQQSSSLPTSAMSTSPRVHTPRIKKPLEIINPQTKMRVGSPAIQNK
ncbi:uncharacterized protein RJT21DRAFT_115527 [Scheffersomyces amazonensis]|uniref:uncharacterized protein n=1 Tax=Scheffersomyces amazonensis TaxID=1078765 RepID=UPI00315D800C